MRVACIQRKMRIVDAPKPLSIQFNVMQQMQRQQPTLYSLVPHFLLVLIAYIELSKVHSISAFIQSDHGQYSICFEQKVDTVMFHQCLLEFNSNLHNNESENAFDGAELWLNE